MSNGHSRRLEAKAARIRAALIGAAGARAWKKIIIEWRRPGWTTPAEFRLVEGALDTLLAQTEVIAGLRQVIQRGSSAVRPRSG